MQTTEPASAGFFIWENMSEKRYGKIKAPYKFRKFLRFFLPEAVKIP